MKCEPEKPAFVITGIQRNKTTAYIKKWSRRHGSIFQNQNFSDLQNDKQTAAAILSRHEPTWRGQSAGHLRELRADRSLRDRSRASGGRRHVDAADHVATRAVWSAKIRE